MDPGGLPLLTASPHFPEQHDFPPSLPALVPTQGGGPPGGRVTSEAGEQLCVLDVTLAQSLVIAVLFQKLEKYL